MSRGNIIMLAPGASPYEWCMYSAIEQGCLMQSSDCRTYFIFSLKKLFEMVFSLNTVSTTFFILALEKNSRNMAGGIQL